MRHIDADKLQLYLNDYAIQVSPSENDDEKTRKWNEIVYMTIDTCMKAVDEQPTADVVERVQRNEDFDRVIEELLEIEAKNDIGFFTSSERRQFNAYVEDLLSMTIERADK